MGKIDCGEVGKGCDGPCDDDCGFEFKCPSYAQARDRAERDSLRAEVERLRGERDAEHAEVERLKKERDSACALFFNMRAKTMEEAAGIAERMGDSIGGAWMELPADECDQRCAAAGEVAAAIRAAREGK